MSKKEELICKSLRKPPAKGSSLGAPRHSWRGCKGAVPTESVRATGCRLGSAEIREAQLEAPGRILTGRLEYQRKTEQLLPGDWTKWPLLTCY